MRLMGHAPIGLPLLVLAGCGGSGGVEAVGADSATDRSQGSIATVSLADAESTNDGGGLAVAQRSATVTIGAEQYEINGNTACVTAGFVSVTFATSGNEITINDSGDLILIRMRLQDKACVGDGSPEPPEVIEVDGHKVVSGSGTMSSDGVPEMVSMEIGC